MALINFGRETLLKIIIAKIRCTKLESSCDSKTHSNAVQKTVNDETHGRDPEIIKLETENDKRTKLLQKCKILNRGEDDFILISGVPLEITCTRPARIHQPTKNAQQQGTRHLGNWLLDFDTKQRWENPLMGWCASGDAISNLQMQFSSKEDAIDYCKKNHLKFWVQESKTYKKFKVKSYGENFHFNRRTRVSTK